MTNSLDSMRESLDSMRESLYVETLSIDWMTPSSNPAKTSLDCALRSSHGLEQSRAAARAFYVPRGRFEPSTTDRRKNERNRWDPLEPRSRFEH